MSLGISNDIINEEDLYFERVFFIGTMRFSCFIKLNDTIESTTEKEIDFILESFLKEFFCKKLLYEFNLLIGESILQVEVLLKKNDTYLNGYKDHLNAPWDYLLFVSLSDTNNVPIQTDQNNNPANGDIRIENQPKIELKFEPCSCGASNSVGINVAEEDNSLPSQEQRHIDPICPNNHVLTGISVNENSVSDTNIAIISNEHNKQTGTKQQSQKPTKVSTLIAQKNVTLAPDIDDDIAFFKETEDWIDKDDVDLVIDEDCL